jgi:hypothetical protein
MRERQAESDQNKRIRVEGRSGKRESQLRSSSCGEEAIGDADRTATLELREQEKKANENPRQRIAHLGHDVERLRATDKSEEVRALQKDVRHQRKLDARNNDLKWRLKKITHDNETRRVQSLALKGH